MEVRQGNSSRGKLMATDTTNSILMASVIADGGRDSRILPARTPEKGHL